MEEKVKIANDNETAANNVINFTGKWKGSKKFQPPKTKEEGDLKIAKLIGFFVVNTVKILHSQIHTGLANIGIDIRRDPKYARDNQLIAEAIRSTILKAYGIHHPLQDFAKVNISVPGDPMKDDPEMPTPPPKSAA